MFTKENGYVFVGEWKDDKKVNGQSASESGTYEGQFLNGKFHGQGMFKWKDGGAYVGQWRNGKMVDGVTTLPNGDTMRPLM